MKKYFLSIIFLVGLPLTVWGQFTLSGSIITHTGTASDLTGLSAVSGVVSYTEGERTIYDVGANAIYFDGTLEIDGTTEGIVSTNTGWAFRFRPNANVTINDFTDENSYKTYHENKVLSAGKDGNVYLDAGAKLTMNGGWIECGGVNTPESLQNSINMDFEYAVFGSYKTTVTNKSFRTHTQNLNVTGKLILIKMDYTIRAVPNNPINEIESRYANTSFLVSGTSPSVENEFKNFSGKGNNNLCALWSSKKFVFPNTENGTDYTVVPNSVGHTGSVGTVQIKKEVQVTLEDTSGTVLENAVIYIRDTDNGNRTNGNGYTFTADRTYTETTSSSGQSPVFEVLTGVVNEPVYDATPDWDYRSKNGNTDDEFDLHFWHYQKVYSSSTQELKGLNTLSFDWVLFDDTNLSETTQATVDAYTELENLDKLYDRAKSWKVSSTHVEYPTIDKLLAIPDGNSLDLEGRDLVIDASAATVFGVNTSTHVITLKATTLVTGNRFMSITTTGTVSFQNSATAEFGYEDSNGKNKYVQLDGLSSMSIEIVDTSNSASHTIVTSQSSFTGDYKTHFIFPSGATEITVRVKSPSGYTIFSEVFPDADLNFIRNNVSTNISEERQVEMLNLSEVMLAQSAVVAQALSGNAQTLTVTNTVTSQVGATIENQDAIFKMLHLILEKVTVNREVVRP